jgi:quercetin dioxygenase-like cupin family protein
VNDHFVVRIPRKIVYAVASAAVVVGSLAIPLQVRGDGAKGGGREGVLMAQPLADIPGKQLTAVLVNYAPGGKSPAHHHAGSVFAFVVSGSIRSESSATGPVKVYQAGESFFEPVGSTHLVSENGSATEPAQLLAVFVADANAKLTTPGK